MITDKQKELLATFVTKGVRLCNQAYDDLDANRMGLQVCGVLEQTEEDKELGRYFVRVNDTSAGTSGVSFGHAHVLEASISPSGMPCIFLR